MTRVEYRISKFINMVFRDTGFLSASEMNIEDRTFWAIIQFKKKMLTCQIGIIAAVEDSFFRYFSFNDLSDQDIYSMAFCHCEAAYDVYPNIFFALLYSCSFLVTLVDCCVRNGLPEFKGSAPELCKNVFGYVTKYSYSLEEWEKLLEFSTGFNIPEMIDMVKSCITGNNQLFTVRKIDRNYKIFGMCDVSALERCLTISMPVYGASLIAFSLNLNINTDYHTSIITSFLECEESIKLKLLQITGKYSQTTCQN